MAEYPTSSDQDKTPQLIDENGSAARRSTQLSLRVWCIDPEFVSWSCESLAIHLIADLVMASGGHLVPEPREPLIAHFDCQESAVVAARRVQKALHAFTEITETQGFAASIMICWPEEQVRAGAEWDVARSLSQSIPGQILVSGTLYETLQFVPGLKFRPPADPLVGKGAVEELLWTDDETLGAWQNRVEKNPARALVSDDSRLRSEAGDSSSEQHEAEILDNPNAGQQEDRLADFGTTKKRVYFATGLVAIVLLAAFVLWHRSTAKVSAVPLQPFTPAPTEQPVDVHPDDSKPTGNESEKKPETESQERGATSAKPHVRKNERRVDPEISGDGFTAKQIPQLLNRAEQDRGAGNIEDAKREYGIVLKLDPGNLTAKLGMRKLSLIGKDER